MGLVQGLKAATTQDRAEASCSGPFAVPPQASISKETEAQEMVQTLREIVQKDVARLRTELAQVGRGGGGGLAAEGSGALWCRDGALLRVAGVRGPAVPTSTVPSAVDYITYSLGQAGKAGPWQLALTLCPPGPLLPLHTQLVNEYISARQQLQEQAMQIEASEKLRMQQVGNRLKAADKGIG